jgi:uncharacterized sulfatase
MSYFKIAIWFACTSCLLSCSRSQEPRDKPNILFIMMDDLGVGQFGVYNDTLEIGDFDPFFVHLTDSLQGYSLDSSLAFTKRAIPTLARLADQGVVFTRAYASSNLCAPSRLGIATGVLQNRYGVYRNTDCEASGIPEGTHLAEKMKKLGYATAHIGKWHIGVRDEQVLYDVLQSNGLDKETPLSTLRKTHPGVYREALDKGYIGSVVQKDHPLNNGFDYYYGYNYWASQFYNSTKVWENFKYAGRQRGYNTDVFTDRAMDFMKTQVGQAKPFYVQLHYHAVHDSLEPMAPVQYIERFHSDSYDLNNFYAHVYGVDINMNRLVGFLESTGQMENTLIIFTSDNGAMCMGAYDGHKTGSPLPGNAPFSGHKGNYYQGGIRVPMFIHWPAGIREEGLAHQLVSNLDIIPTAIDAAGGVLPYGIDGKSLLPILKDTDHPGIRDYLIWSGIHSSAWGFLIKRTIKDHVNEREYAPAAWVVVKGNYLLRFTCSIEAGVYLDHIRGREPIFELYNILTDPAETINLADTMPGVVQELAEIFKDESVDFLQPVSWDKNKWEEMMKWEVVNR